MKILALIKYSLDVSEIKVDSATNELRMAGVPSKIGNIDKNVVELAVKLKESSGGTALGLCFGPAAARESFKDVLAMGLDEVFLVADPFADGVESAVAVRIMEAAIQKLGSFDLIIAGFASDDGYSYQVAPRLAESLDLPLISYVRQISVADGKLQADRDLEDGLQTVVSSLPALISVAEEAFPPRRTTLMDAIKAKKKAVTIWQVQDDLGLAPAELEGMSYFSSTSKIGVVVHRKQNIFKGKTCVEMADQLIDALLQENVLKGGA